METIKLTESQIMNKPCWTPDPVAISETRLSAFMRHVAQSSGVVHDNYASLWAWSVEKPEAFWRAVWDFSALIGEPGTQVLEWDAQQGMLGASWFSQARLNFAENLLRPCSNPEALVFWGEDRVRRSLSRQQLYVAVAQLCAALNELGVVAGDRVAVWLPNMPEAIIAMLSCASIGAIFTSASPDFGVQGALDRFGQVAPKVLIGVDGYYYNGKIIDVSGKLTEVARQLPTLNKVIVVAYVAQSCAPEGITISWQDFVAPHALVESIAFAALPRTMLGSCPATGVVMVTAVLSAFWVVPVVLAGAVRRMIWPPAPVPVPREPAIVKFAPAVLLVPATTL